METEVRDMNLRIDVNYAAAPPLRPTPAFTQGKVTRFMRSVHVKFIRLSVVVLQPIYTPGRVRSALTESKAHLRPGVAVAAVHVGLSAMVQ